MKTIFIISFFLFANLIHSSGEGEENMIITGEAVEMEDAASSQTASFLSNLAQQTASLFTNLILTGSQVIDSIQAQRQRILIKKLNNALTQLENAAQPNKYENLEGLERYRYFNKMKEIGEKINDIVDKITDEDEKNRYNFIWARFNKRYTGLNPLGLPSCEFEKMDAIHRQMNEMPHTFAQIALEEEIYRLELSNRFSENRYIFDVQIKLLKKAEFIRKDQTFIYSSTIENIDQYKINDYESLSEENKIFHKRFHNILNETTIISISPLGGDPNLTFAANEKDIYNSERNFIFRGYRQLH